MCIVCYVTVYWWQEVATEYWHTIEVRRFVPSAFSALAFSALTLLVGQLASHVLCMLCMFSGCPLTLGGSQWTYTGFLQWVEFLEYVCVCWVVIHWLQSSASEYTIIVGRFVMSLQLLKCVVYVVYVQWLIAASEHIVLIWVGFLGDVFVCMLRCYSLTSCSSHAVKIHRVPKN